MKITYHAKVTRPDLEALRYGLAYFKAGGGGRRIHDELVSDTKEGLLDLVKEYNGTHEMRCPCRPTGYTTHWLFVRADDKFKCNLEKGD